MDANHPPQAMGAGVVQSCSSDLRAIGIDPVRDFDLTFKQVSTILGIPTRTVRWLCKTRRLGCIRHNGKIVTVPLFEIRAYRAKRYEAGVTPETVAIAAIDRHSAPSKIETQRTAA